MDRGIQEEDLVCAVEYCWEGRDHVEEGVEVGFWVDVPGDGLPFVGREESWFSVEQRGCYLHMFSHASMGVRGDVNSQHCDGTLARKSDGLEKYGSWLVLVAGRGWFGDLSGLSMALVR